jgi:endoglycosylceramidase
MRATRTSARSTCIGLLLGLALIGAACTSPGVVTFPTGDGGVVTVEEPDVAPPLRFRGRDLVDAHGRVVLIHGTNVVNKSAPFIPPLSDGWLGAADLELFHARGWNGVRLGVWAAALMPEPGVIDDEYLDRLEAVVERLQERDLWVLLDFHQDVFWGMPAWATTPEGAALSASQPAFLDGIGWAAAYASPRSLRQWEDFWANVAIDGGRGVVDLYGDGVAAVAERFADVPNVIGIDLLNEPFAGEQFIGCLSECGARYRQVAEAFASMTERARAVAPDLPVWWEPFTFGPPFPGVSDPGDNIGYTFHAYCLDTDGGRPVAPDPAVVLLCRAVFGEIFGQAQRVSAAWDTPVILGEFGASNSPLNASLAAELADQHLLSWLHWHHPPQRYPEVVESHLVRPYAQATAGRPLLQRFDPVTGVFRFRYEPDHSISEPTSIAVPGEHYPNGYDVVVTGGVVTSSPDSGRLTIEPDPASAQVEVEVSRRP